MKPYTLLGLASLALAACARTPAPTTPAPVPAASTPATATRADSLVPATSLQEPPRNWQLLDAARDGVAGISAERALSELLAGRQPKRSVVVAVIDGGTDTAHVDLRANLWTNPREVAGNGRDDDGNGYTDDVHGWDFIGGKGGEVGPDTYEVTRLYARCTSGKAAEGLPPLAPELRAQCDDVKRSFETMRGNAQSTLIQVRAVDATLTPAVATLRRALGTDSLTPERVQALSATTPEVQRARQVYLQLAANGISPKDIAELLKAFTSQVEYGTNPDFNPRPVVGDNYANLSERAYGNANVTGPDALHGTHVAGIIGAVRGNGTGVDGVAPAVRLMIVRAVPDGDERDKDVANAIRYAADNGANVINMSFGKGWSPEKGAVDEAVRYADSKGVLMVHAAGNESTDLATGKNFPTPVYLNGGRASNWIEVGATSWKGGENLVATFSNYGQQQVDVFAPGVDILSTVQGGGYERESGTSMAAPVVTGLAALLMSYYPDLTAADVKRIILASAVRHPGQRVLRPGAEGATGTTTFGTLSATGGIVNAYEAVRMAEQAGAPRP